VKTALIDADTLIYEASLGAEKAIEWHDDLWTLHADLNEAKAKFTELVDTIKDATGASRLVLALSDGDSARRWRNTVMATYKMNRKKVRRPVVYGPLRDFCHKEYETFERPTLEGDDVLGILMTHPSLVKGDKVCVSIDKDLKTIPGEHYNYGKEETHVVVPSEADYHHMHQTLTGDTTDGYPGCPGIGKVTASKLLDGQLPEDHWPIIVATYKKAGLSEEVALMNARVARILRAQDYDFKKKEVVLWRP
jgi:DNA polymerase-1